MKSKFRARILMPVVLGALLPVGALVGCEKDEPPPPLPSAAPTTAPTEELVLEPEDAGVEDADAKPKGKGGPYKPGPSLKACCSALQQNSASAPEPNATYMKQAAATCNAMVASGQGKGSVLGAVRGMLKGAGMPAACH